MTLVTVGLAKLMREILTSAWKEQYTGTEAIQNFSTFDELLRIDSGHQPDVIIVESATIELASIQRLFPVSSVASIKEQGATIEWYRPRMPMEKYCQLSAEQLLNVILMAKP